MASILVVGAGLAGLSCAWRLTRAGHEVEVYEQAATPGGRMRTERRRGFGVDLGVRSLASGDLHLRHLARELGLEDRLRPLARRGTAVLRQGRLEPGEFGELRAFLRSGLLSVRARARLPWLLLELFRERAWLDPVHPERAAERDHEDMAAWMKRTAGSEAFEHIFAPAFTSAYDAEPEDLSAVFALLALRVMASGTHRLCFEGGNGLLTRTLADRLELRVGWKVTRVEPDQLGVNLGFVSPSGERSTRAEAVVLAVPGSLVEELAPGLTQEERRFFAQVRYGRSVEVQLLLEKAPETLRFHGVAFPRLENLGLSGLWAEHDKPGCVPPDAGLVRVSLSPAEAQRRFDAPDEALASWVLDELARTPLGTLEPVEARVCRYDPSLPRFHAGYTCALRDFLGRDERSPRLAFAGDYLVAPSAEGALVSGLRAAEEIQLGL